MAIDSVGSSAGAAASAARLAAEAQQVERRESKPEQRAETNTNNEAPKPVKNVEGQTTGSVVNVTA